MCYNCGCYNPSDDMGNPDNLTEEKMVEMATKEKQDLKVFKTELFNQLEAGKVSSEMENEFIKAAKAWGQSVDEAKKNTRDLLKTEIK